VLGAGYAYEQRAQARTTPRYLAGAAVAAGLEGRTGQ